MSESRKVVRVFLASPGDLKEERAQTKRIIDELNQTWGSFHGYHVDLVGWELTISAFGRPQEVINRELDTCEYFLGIVYKRWGTPPAKSGPFTSGFEEEFRRSIERKKSSNKPEITLLFKRIDQTDLLDPGDQLKRVLAFKHEIAEAKELLYDEFSTLEDFSEKIRRAVSHHIQRLLQMEQVQNIESQVETDDLAIERVRTDLPPKIGYFPDEASEFLCKFTESSAPDDPGSPAPAEVARFRLLGSVLSAAGCDKVTLGTHDSNIIFEAREHLKLSKHERLELIKAGLLRYEHENTPLWYWLVPFLQKPYLALLSIVGVTDEEKHGALLAMSDIGEGLPVDPELPRTTFHEHWFEKDASADRKVAALRYLSEFGIRDDLPAIRGEFNLNNFQTASAATDAIIRINLRDSGINAFAALLELQPKNVSPGLIDDVFSRIDGVSDASLKDGLGQPSAEVRLATVRLLARRGVVDRDIADKLLSDPSRAVRLEAMTFLIAHDRTFTEQEARHLLMEPVPDAGLGLFSQSPGRSNEAYLDEFKRRRLRTLSDRELEKALDTSIFDRWEEFVLAERRFGKYGPRLRRAVAGLFKTEFDAALARMESEFSDYGDLIKKTRNLENFLRQQHTRAALNVICRRGDAKDLILVRQVLATGFVGASPEDIRYLGRYGEWIDIALILNLVRQPMNLQDVWERTFSSALTSSNAGYCLTAHIICVLGRGRLHELLEMPIPDNLLIQIILEIPATTFPTLEDEQLIRLFSAEHADVRKAAALRCVATLPQGRQEELLRAYMKKEEFRYYNVIFWLDFGISLPRRRIIPATRRIIERTWRKRNSP